MVGFEYEVGGSRIDACSLPGASLRPSLSGYTSSPPTSSRATATFLPLAKINGNNGTGDGLHPARSRPATIRDFTWCRPFVDPSCSVGRRACCSSQWACTDYSSPTRGARGCPSMRGAGELLLDSWRAVRPRVGKEERRDVAPAVRCSSSRARGGCTGERAVKSQEAE
ncbi:hypothetical protein MSAN_00776700 [Mycena sanguinolenta]|uniref:Uncharacterized protein n=1 Tax=Mycena sanguinolenta TaxID=230812 RepID=A0A8H6Z6T8_9AGAR|nr:hypothetical protein MSAN_00776700 [Mycena sanguinolenta]